MRESSRSAEFQERVTPVVVRKVCTRRVLHGGQTNLAIPTLQRDVSESLDYNGHRY